ncbi:MAG TPA: polymer-forming cytoskeletal protein [Thermoanaerobaculia bacterium]|nr:polymer-forming cytoskeletal protein [Thermoanaerobaculia bacterium]
MALFRRDTGSSSPASPGGSSDSPSPSLSSSSSSSAQRRRVTHIAAGSKIEGKLSGPTELLIEGEVEGEIRVESAVMVGTEGVVRGPISAQVIRVGGRVVGDVQAADRVEVAPSGSLEGDISAPRVVIAEGAFFKGRIDMRSDRDKEKDKDKAPEPRRKGAEAGAPQKASAESGT